MGSGNDWVRWAAEIGYPLGPGRFAAPLLPLDGRWVIQRVGFLNDAYIWHQPLADMPLADGWESYILHGDIGFPWGFPVMPPG